MSAAAPPARRAGRTLYAELIKLLTLPAVPLTAVLTWGISVILALAFTAAAARGHTGTTSAVDVGLAPVGYAQAGLVVLGVLAATSEYAGQVYTSLVSVPRRVELLVAKTLALAAVSVPVGLVTVVAGITIAKVALERSTEPSGAATIAGAAAGATAYLTLTALLSFAVAALVRRSIPALATLLGYFFVAGPLLRDRSPAAKYLPDTAGYALWFPAADDTGQPLSPASGAAVLLLWVVAAIVIATSAFARRDA